MATGPEHYVEAEQDIAWASEAESEETQQFHLARAQVHATLALTAATVDNDPERGKAPSDWDAWLKAGAILP